MWKRKGIGIDAADMRSWDPFQIRSKIWVRYEDPNGEMVFVPKAFIKAVRSALGEEHPLCDALL